MELENWEIGKILSISSPISDMVPARSPRSRGHFAYPKKKESAAAEGDGFPKRILKTKKSNFLFNYV